MRLSELLVNVYKSPVKPCQFVFVLERDNEVSSSDKDLVIVVVLFFVWFIQVILKQSSGWTC